MPFSSYSFKVIWFSPHISMYLYCYCEMFLPGNVNTNLNIYFFMILYDRMMYYGIAFPYLFSSGWYKKMGAFLTFWAMNWLVKKSCQSFCESSLCNATVYLFLHQIFSSLRYCSLIWYPKNFFLNVDFYVSYRVFRFFRSLAIFRGEFQIPCKSNLPSFHGLNGTF